MYLPMFSMQLDNLIETVSSLLGSFLLTLSSAKKVDVAAHLFRLFVYKESLCLNLNGCSSLPSVFPFYHSCVIFQDLSTI